MRLHQTIRVLVILKSNKVKKSELGKCFQAHYLQVHPWWDNEGSIPSMSSNALMQPAMVRVAKEANNLRLVSLKIN